MNLTRSLLEALDLGAGHGSAHGAFTTIGRSVPRADGMLKVTGKATYTAEWNVPGVVHAAVVDSTIACGTILAMQTDEALAAPGVITVVTQARPLSPEGWRVSTDWRRWPGGRTTAASKRKDLLRRAVDRHRGCGDLATGLPASMLTSTTTRTVS